MRFSNLKFLLFNFQYIFFLNLANSFQYVVGLVETSSGTPNTSLLDVPFSLGDLYPLDIRRVKGRETAPPGGRSTCRNGERIHFSAI